MPHQLNWQEICQMIPKRKADAQKGDFGRLLCITGSRNMPGACLLSTQAALRGGAGLVTVATAPENPMRLAAAAPEAMWLPLETDEAGFLRSSDQNRKTLEKQLSRANAVLLGCGLGVTEETRRLVHWVLEQTVCPVVLDADGLNCAVSCIELSRRTGKDWILTPHPGEMARLTGRSIPQIQENRVETATQFAAAYPVTLALKGAGTLVAQGSRLAQNPTGNPGMSRGGSGDVLAGLIAAFATQGIPSTALPEMRRRQHCPSRQCCRGTCWHICRRCWSSWNRNGEMYPPFLCPKCATLHNIVRKALIGRKLHETKLQCCLEFAARRRDLLYRLCQSRRRSHCCSKAGR